jgi:hypothetical protein
MRTKQGSYPTHAPAQAARLKEDAPKPTDRACHKNGWHKRPAFRLFTSAGLSVEVLLLLKAHESARLKSA